MPSPPRRKWSDLPHAVRRLVWWWVVPFIILMPAIAWFWFAGGAALFMNWGMGRHPWTGVFIPLSVNAPIVVPMVVISRAIRRLKRAYAASEGCLCTICEHNLRGLGEHGACPECGQPFDLERDRKAWKQAGIGD